MTERESHAVMTQQPQARADLEKIYRAAVAAVEPGRLVGLAMDGGCRGAEQVPDLIAGASRILLLAVGKASIGMAGEIERRVGDRLVDGIAVVPKISAATTEPALILKKAATTEPALILKKAATTERALILKKARSDVAADFFNIKVVGSAHPVPDESSVEAARLGCEMLHRATADDLVI